jgi:hypothetical protein
VACANDLCAFGIRMTLNLTVTFTEATTACVSEAVVDASTFAQHIRGAAVHTPSNMGVVVAVGTPTCPSSSAPVTQFLNFTVTLTGLEYALASSPAVRACVRGLSVPAGPRPGAASSPPAPLVPPTSHPALLSTLASPLTVPCHEVVEGIC